eukprot:Anaeramoba_ignava/a90457_317.p1 GENE.a90457_317~~a90457_317.p1  ORF type:complete len:695 (+),score=214.82 a90457_317:23-2086(+)
MSEEERKIYQVTEGTPIYFLGAKNSFDQLPNNEKFYAYYISQASWFAAIISMYQTSLESPYIFSIILELFKEEKPEDLKKSSGVDEKVFQGFMDYLAVFLGNMGNYRGFGDQKIVPRITEEEFSKIISSSTKKDVVIPLYEKVKDRIFSLSDEEKTLGFPGEGISTYYSPNIRKPDIELAQKFLDSIKLMPNTTRLFKNDEDGSFIIKMASVEKQEEKTFTFEEKKFILRYGDYSYLLKKMAENLTKAIDYASNETEKKMLAAYARHFTVGNIEDFAESQYEWVKDKSPNVETNIGFIESYRDPMGVRCESEGWVACVDLEQSKKFANLVAKATELIPNLPWPKDFELETFLAPDFTSINVLTFGGSGVPLGINVPNLPWRDRGFKNVNLQNVLLSRVTDKVSFLNKEDEELAIKYFVGSFEVQVGLHELLGHGTGKLLMENPDGSLNFDPKAIDPTTGKPIAKWYKPGETYDGKFTTLASSMEECRAESVGLFLCVNDDVLRIFGFNDEKEKQNVIYINWLWLLRSSVIGIEHYSPEQKLWKQAHCCARFAILRKVMEAGIIKIVLNEKEDNMTIELDRDQILSKGVQAMHDLLMHINVYKSTGNYQDAKEMFDKLIFVDDFFLKVRKIVMLHKTPRPIYIQSNFKIENDQKTIDVIEYEKTTDGMIQSFIERFKDFSMEYLDGEF